MRSGSLIDEICSNFKERDLAVKRCAIESALEDPAAGRKNVEWVSKHLRPETLLSREELTLYTKLENSGLLHPLLRDPDLGATRPLLEDDIRTAIESLEASTTAIQKQSETLSLQCGTLKKQLHGQESLDQERTRDIARLRKKHETGRQNTTIAANELSDELDASFRSAMERAGAENKRILSSVSTQLKYDDKALTTLEALVSGVRSSRYDASIIKRTTDLCAMLADYSAEEIHCRLDRTYLETIEVETSNDDHAVAKPETIAALREELESLYPEIEVLAELSTQKQFHEPILRGIHNEHGQLRAASQQKLEQALDVLIDMILNKQTYTKQLEDRESSCELLERLASLCQTEVGIDSVSQPPSRRESLRRRSMQPGTLLAASREVAPLPEQPALESFLRRIGVNPESALRPRVEGGDAHELHGKRIHMSETVRSLGVAVGWPLVTQMAPSNSASQLLAAALYANSYFDTSLRDPNQEEALSALETELVSLQKGMQGIKLDILHQRDKCRERFLERWSQSQQHSDAA